MSETPRPQPPVYDPRAKLAAIIEALRLPAGPDPRFADHESIKAHRDDFVVRVQASENGSPRALEEMGTGEQQVLAMAFAHAFARAFHGGILLVIEEPEAHLHPHPLAQRWLAEQLSDMSADGLQIIITTHSPSFIEMMSVPGVALIRTENGATSVTQRTTAQLVQHCLASGAPAARTTEEHSAVLHRKRELDDLGGILCKSS